jgi:hypothetical protein
MPAKQGLAGFCAFAVWLEGVLFVYTVGFVVVYQ